METGTVAEMATAMVVGMVMETGTVAEMATATATVMVTKKIRTSKD
jgi:hypothetical protein